MKLKPIAKHDSPRSAGVLSSGETAYNIIAAKILSGDLPPGEKLSVRVMAGLTGVSTIPVIEALQRLEYEGLVESFPNWGSRVVALTPETVRDRNALREAVECQAVRIVAEADLSKEEQLRLESLVEELDALPRSNEQDNPFWTRHYEFHMELVKLTGCFSLERALHNVNLFHLLQRNILAKQEMLTHIPGDLHLRIVQAILDKDPDAAETAMREHIRLSRNGIPAGSTFETTGEDK